WGWGISSQYSFPVIQNAASASRCSEARRGGRWRHTHSGPANCHLIGKGEEQFRNGKPERSGSGKIDDEVKLGRLLDPQVACLGPAQNLVDVAGAPIVVQEVRQWG